MTMNRENHTHLLRFLRFASSSLVCTAVDQMVAGVLFSTLRLAMPEADLLRILIATLVARVTSVTLNLTVNRRLVFSAAEDARSRRTTLRFIELSAFVLTLSTLGTWWLHVTFGIPEWIAKPCVDFVLFFVNYNAQRIWVFRADETDVALA